MLPKNEKQEKLIQRARIIASKIESTSALHDQNGTFPHEHFAFMRKEGYLHASVPIEYGGTGHGLTDLVLAQHEIGTGDGSTAVSVGMHHMVVGAEAESRRWPEELRKRIFTEIIDDGALVNNIASEPDLGSPRGGGRPATAAGASAADAAPPEVRRRRRSTAAAWLAVRAAGAAGRSRRRTCGGSGWPALAAAAAKRWSCGPALMCAKQPNC